ncbi:Rv0361 family membrane protein [Mycobacterium palustre]|nr:nuclear transport factor 2 family protein [Mycobacterium palustre]
MTTRIAALFAAAVTAACSTVTGGTPATSHTSALSSATVAAPGTSPAPLPPVTPSTEDQIRQTMMAFQDAYNTQNWEAYTDLMCTAMRARFTGPVMDYVKKGRDQTGLTTITITSVTVTGDTATVAMDSRNEAVGSRAVTMPLKHEDGWKICML